MKTDVRTVYHCEHCNKISLNKGAMTLHEDKCKRNPVNRSYCIGCKHLTVEDIEYNDKPDECDYDEFAPSVRPRRRFTCDIDNKVMYHPKVRTFSKKKRELIFSISQKPMPNEVEECDNFEDKIPDFTF